MIAASRFSVRAFASGFIRTHTTRFRATRLPFSVLLVGIWATASLAVADDSVDRLVRLVGRDAGLCVEIPRLEETVTAFEQGEFFQRLQRSRIYADWQSGSEYRHARGIVSVIENFTGKSFRQFFHDMFGRAVVVGVYAERGPEMSAIMLTETSSREALDAVIEGWNRAEAQQTDAIEFSGQTYYKRTCSAKSGPGTMVLFYCKLDRTLMLTDREEWIRRSLTLARDPGENESLLGLPAYQEARKSLQGGQAARAYVNPRAWDRVLGFTHAPDSNSTSATSSETSKTSSPAGAATTPTPPPAGFTKALEAAWKRCEWLALGLQVDRGIVVEAVARYSMNGVSERGRQWIRSMSGPADFLRLIPHDALVAVAGRQAFGDLLKHLAPQNEAGALDSVRQVSRGLLLGLDPFEDVLPAFRENFGAYLVPRKDAKPDDLPIDGLVAAELPPVETTISPRAGFTPTAGSSATSNVTPERPPTFRDALDNGLNIGLNLAAAYFNMGATGKPAIVRTESRGPTRTRWVDSLGPYQPAYSLTSRFLVLATSPQEVRHFISREGASAPGTIPPAIEALAKRYFPKENQVLYVDTAGIRRFLVEHGQQLVQHAARVRSISSADANEVLTHFLDVASLFDSVFAAGRIGEGSARLVVGGVIQPESVAKAAATSAGVRSSAPRPSVPGKSSRAD
jgi:hypothetical protein